MAFVGIFVIGLIVLVVGGLIYGIILTSGGGSRGGSGEMSCGGCGYAVRGLETINCPECGGDLRQVGINRGQRSGGRGLGIALTVGCVVLLLFGAFGILMFKGSGGPSQPVSIPATLTQPAPAPPIAPATDTSPDDTPEDSVVEDSSIEDDTP